MSLTPRLDRLENNAIINGNFDWWQRGTSASTTANDAIVKSVDRWYARIDGTQSSGTSVLDQVTDTPSSKFTYALRLRQSAGSFSGAQYHFRHVIEKYVADSYVLNSEGSVLSFWYKSNRVGSHGIQIAIGGGTAYVGFTAFNSSFIVNAANTWEFKSIQLPQLASANSTAALNTAGILINIGPIAGSANLGTIATNDYFIISRAMLTKGTTVPSQDYYSYAGRDALGEFALCQRYYEKSYNLQTAPGTAVGSLFTTTRGSEAGGGGYSANIIYKVPKRTTATITLYNPNGSVGTWLNGNTGANPSVSVTFNGEAMFGVRLTAPSSALINESAHGHWTADAEL